MNFEKDENIFSENDNRLTAFFSCAIIRSMIRKNRISGFPLSDKK